MTAVLLDGLKIDLARKHNISWLLIRDFRTMLENAESAEELKDAIRNILNEMIVHLEKEGKPNIERK